MSQPENNRSSEFQPTVRKRRRISSVWIVPLVALGLAGWLVWKNQIDQGPAALVTFETAEGIAAGKTPVRCRSVDVGVVESVLLAPDLQSVQVAVRLAPPYGDLLREGTRFWVVRPRVSTGTVSGLGTLITGAYIELDPGTGEVGKSRFKGLEEPPVTSGNIPGLRLTLVAEKAGSLTPGSAIYHRGFEVGKVERRVLDMEARRIRFEIYIQDRYASLVRTTTRFWNTSGVEVTAGAEGFKLRTPSIQSILAGGATFAVPPGEPLGEPAASGAVFTLYDDEAAARDASFIPDQRFLLFFDQSIRGLSRGAPVEFRGIQLGRVVEISYRHSPQGESGVPVLIELDTDTLRRATELNEDGSFSLERAVDRGLRARLSTASLLTGALFVELDLVPGATPAEVRRIDEFKVIPTMSGGIAQLESRLNQLLTKIENLPIEPALDNLARAADETATTVAASRETLKSLETTLADLHDLLGGDAAQALPAELSQTLAELRASLGSLGPSGAVQGDLRRTLDELRATLRSFNQLTDTIEERPNSLIFGNDRGSDPVPRARR